MTPEQIILIGSYSGAKKLWNEEFGEPQFFTEADVPDVEDFLRNLECELITLEAEIARRDNMSHYKLNRAIALHFVVKSGNEYIDEINALVYEGVYEAELEHLDSIDGMKKHPWELI
jgi:hypothetical protein